MGWFLDSLEWTSGKLLSGAGHVASFVGASDTGELLKSAGDPTYTPEVFKKGIPANATPEQKQQVLAETKRFNDSVQQTTKAIEEKAKPILPYSYIIIDSVDEDGKAMQKYSPLGKPVAATKEGREQQKKECNEFDADIQNAAKNTETVLVTTAQAAAAVAAIPTGPVGMVMAAEAVEGFTDTGLKVQGQAPTRSLRKVYSPINGDYGPAVNSALEGFSYIGADIRGDQHYYNGGSPQDHPYIAEHQKKMDDITRAAFAKHGLNPDGTPLNGASNDNDGAPTQPGSVQTRNTTPQGQGRTENGTDNAKPGFFESIWIFLKNAFNKIVNLFKKSDPQPQVATSSPVVEHTEWVPIILDSGIPNRMQKTVRGR